MCGVFPPVRSGFRDWTYLQGSLASLYSIYILLIQLMLFLKNQNWCTFVQIAGCVWSKWGFWALLKDPTERLLCWSSAFRTEAQHPNRWAGCFSPRWCWVRASTDPVCLAFPRLLLCEPAVEAYPHWVLGLSIPGCTSYRQLMSDFLFLSGEF